MLQRTQILLDAETKRDLAYLSEVTNRSMSELVRQFLAEKVKVEKKRVDQKQKTKGKRMTGAEALLAMAKAAEEIDRKYGYEGPTDWSINHDHYLYGLPKKQQK
jgi:predicted transcriptional regulator